MDLVGDQGTDIVYQFCRASACAEAIIIYINQIPI